MRPRITRALTAALAIVGAAGAIALPTLSLGTAKPPTHAFSLPATRGDVVIEADALAPVARPSVARPQADRPSKATSSPGPAVQTSVVVTPASRTSPPATVRRAAPPPPKAVQVPAAAPPVVATPTPAAEPEPQPLPPAERAAPAPSAVRLVTAYTPAADQAADAGSKKHKPKQEKAAKENGGGKPKRDKAQKPAPEPVPAAAESLPPAEVPSEQPEHEEATPDVGKHGDKEHGGHGKGHDKQK